MSPYYWQRGKYWIKFDRLTIDPDSWAGIQQSVRKGEASARFDIGDEFVSTYDGQEMSWQIIGIDQDTPTDENYTHSLTLQSKEVLESNIKISNIDGDNRYINSDIRAYLNNNINGFLNKIDIQLKHTLGEVIKKVDIPLWVDTEDIQDIFYDKVFLLSGEEIGIYRMGNPIPNDEFYYDFYYLCTTHSTDYNYIREKFIIGTEDKRDWWFRSPNTYDDPSLYYYMGYMGATNVPYAQPYYQTSGLAPALVIV